MQLDNVEETTEKEINKYKAENIKLTSDIETMKASFEDKIDEYENNIEQLKQTVDHLSAVNENKSDDFELRKNYQDTLKGHSMFKIYNCQG